MDNYVILHCQTFNISIMENLFVPVELVALLEQCAMYIGECRDNGKDPEAVHLTENLFSALSKLRMPPVGFHEFECLKGRVMSENVFKNV